MRISDWSSDVCSSDLSAPCARQGRAAFECKLCRAQGALLHVGFRVRPHVLKNLGNAAAEDVVRRFLQRARDLRVDRHVRQRTQPPDQLGQFRRSEEHKSELQTLMRRSYAVFCMKKKQVRRKKHEKQ